MDIYSFGLGDQVTETSVEVLGGKGGGLVWMASNGLNVPPGFVIPCKYMAAYEKAPKTFLKQLSKEIKPFLKKLENHFGYMPLVSVRSGARVSLPGMMDTILNVGIDESNVLEWAKRIGNDCVLNSENRLIHMYGAVVKGINKKHFDRCEVPGDSFPKYKELTGEDFPKAQEQLLGSIEAVFQSWNNDRAKIYRKLNNIPEDWGTAVVVQAMVFGNFNDQSCTGVLFTRNPDTGENELTGEFAVNAQGEDVVDGSTTPRPLTELKAWNEAVAQELAEVSDRAEKLKGDVQDMEFTVQDGKLYILQTRNAKRTPIAALKIGVDMVEEGLISWDQLTSRIQITDFDKAQQCVINPKFDKKPMANGISACSGVTSGRIVLTAKQAVATAEAGIPCILVTNETTPDDIAGMYAAQGIVTMTGGSTCHAAVVARGMNKPCIVGVGLPLIQFQAGETLGMDGGTGRIWDMEVPVIDGHENEAAAHYLRIMRGALKYVPIVDGPDAQGAKVVLYHASPSPQLMAKDVANIEKLLPQVDTLYIDLRQTRIVEAEKRFFQLFDQPDQFGYLPLLAALGTYRTDDQKKFVLIGLTESLHKQWKVIRSINTLEDLILAEGLVFSGDLDMYAKAVKMVVAWKEKEGGFKYASYGSLGPDVSFISDVQALQMR
jgi:pyruvate,orthophosphate dikinase